MQLGVNRSAATYSCFSCFCPLVVLVTIFFLVFFLLLHPFSTFCLSCEVLDIRNSLFYFKLFVIVPSLVSEPPYVK